MTTRPMIHMLGLHHTIPSDEFSHCAFTGKVLRFPKVAHAAGYSVTEYANEGSTSEADEHVTIFPREILEHYFNEERSSSLERVDKNWEDNTNRTNFERLVKVAMRKRVQPGDIVAHPFGHTHADLVRAFPRALHVETGIGYQSGPFGAFRIFESEAWRHWHFGRYHTDCKYAGESGPMSYDRSFVVPNYYDVNDWPLGTGDGGYVLFIGRVGYVKGLEIMLALAREFPSLPFVIAGLLPPSDTEEGIQAHDLIELANVQYLGLVRGQARASLFGEALCTLVPSRYVEPFGGAAAESLLCGTPVIASNFGAFMEYQNTGMMTCGALREWERELKAFPKSLMRKEIQASARTRFGLQNCARLYANAFDDIRFH